MPAWIYTLGTVFSNRANLTIPLFGLFGNLLVTIVPCILGLVLGRYFPKLKAFCLKIAKPFTLIILITFFVLVFITKSYIYSLVQLKHWFSGKTKFLKYFLFHHQNKIEMFRSLKGPLIPWTGYLLGGSVAWLLRLPFNQIKTGMFMFNLFISLKVQKNLFIESNLSCYRDRNSKFWSIVFDSIYKFAITRSRLCSIAHHSNSHSHKFTFVFDLFHNENLPKN